jgi:predicted Zn-dependent peptidase
MISELGKFGVSLQKRTLNNGVNLFLFERKGMPVYLRTIFFSGSRFDSVPGTAHFLEHMLLAGSKKFPAKNLIAEHIQRVGGDFGASTSSNSLRINIEIPEAKDIAVGIEVLNEILNEPLFDSQTMENERGSIISEFHSKKSNPKEYIREVSKKVSLQGSPVGRSTLGDLESIKAITKDDLVKHKDAYLTSGRAVFIASGDIEIDLLAQQLNGVKIIEASKFEIGGYIPVLKDKMVYIEHYPGVKELQVIFSCRLSIADFREYCALKLLCNILGEGRGSRLMTRLRYQNGLVYSVSSQIIESPDWGTFGIKLSCDKDNFERVKELIFIEFDELRSKGISDGVISDIKSRIAKSAIRYSQTSESWINFHETQGLFYPDNFKTISDYINEIESLTTSDVENVIEKYLKKEDFFIAICGDY